MKTAVFIGRFQPPHLAHLETMRLALARYDRLIVVLGSAQAYPSVKNPFSAEEREGMIRESLGRGAGEQGGAERRVLATGGGEKDSGNFSPLQSSDSRLHFVHVPDDYYDDPRWFRTVRAGVEAITGKEAEVVITGFDKDESSYYLKGFGDWPFEPSGVKSPLNATDLRGLYFAGTGGWEAMVPGAVRRFLEAFAGTPPYARLAAEAQTLAHYKRLDKAYPYPIIHSAVDAVVIAQNKLLLVERGGALGKGAWALPGGYLEPKETLLEGAKRELREETGLEVQGNQLKAAHVFDYPGRSLRGRVISHAHLFDLGDAEPPPVTGTDDARSAFWLPLADLEPHRPRFFEDHFQIVRWFLERRPT